MRTLAQYNSYATYSLAFALVCSGREEDATILLAANAGRDDSLLTKFNDLLHCALQDDRPGFDRTLDASNIRESCEKDGHLANLLASCFARMGEFPDALNYLERAIDRGFTNHRFLGRLSPFYMPFHRDTRFTALIERARLKEQSLEV